MAGGQFDKAVGKVRPGTYINFESGRKKGILTGVRGTVIIPLPKATYGPEKQFIKIMNDFPDSASAILGYSIFDKDPNRQMLLLREAIKRATTVYIYILTEGKKALATVPMTIETEGADPTTNNLTATAKYGGSRGNAYTVTIDSNPLGGYNVIIHLGGLKVAAYEKLNTVEELIAKNNPYIDFAGTGNLGEAAGVNLTGGTDKEPTNADIAEYIDAWEKVQFNTACFPFEGALAKDVKHAAFSKVKYLRESIGKGVQVVMPDTPNMNYEGVINVTNSVIMDDDELSKGEVCAWVAGATAGASNIESLTHVQYEGATKVAGIKSNYEAISAIKNGEFFFSVNDNKEVIVEYDINSLINYGTKKDKSYRKNRVIRVYDSFQETIQLNFPPNKFSNSPDGWDVMEGVGKAILRLFENIGAIMNVVYDEDFKVDRELSYDDETYFNVSIQAVDSAEKLYFTIVTR